MKLAADFRREARDALRGKWPIAILVGLVAALLGGAAFDGPEFKINYSGGALDANLEYAGQTIYSWGEGITPGLRALLAGGAVYLILLAIVVGVLYFILGSVVEVGYARFNLNLTAGEAPSFETLFSYFPHWKTIALAQLLQTVYIFLWTLLLVIPGIVAGYSYAMTGYILAEHPDMEPSEALKASKAMMEGNRWRLFCLQFSFIGWSILCALTFGLGNLALRPYREAADAAFYRELTGTGYTVL